MTNPYVELTDRFNRGRRRALVSSGQAVVLHRLAIMSKDGDWILREDQDVIDRVLDVLAERGARYRFGAPLDLRWLAGGWSSHFEHSRDGLRLRTDFVTRPPRLSAARLEELWRDADAGGSDVVGLEPLVLMKMTACEKDYAVIGELARRMAGPRVQLQYSRSRRCAGGGARSGTAGPDAGRRNAVEPLPGRGGGVGGGVARPVSPDRRARPARRPPHRHRKCRGRPALCSTSVRDPVHEPRDEFLSEEDLDLQHLSDEELFTYWTLWLQQAQATHDEDAPFYSHGVFERDPAVDDNERE